MAFLNIGTMQGLSFENDWDAQIKTEQNNELLDQQARITAENKAQLLGDKFKMAHLHNAYDNVEYKKFAEQRVKDVGAWLMQNRDFQRNPTKWAYFSQQTDELLNNDIVDRSMRYETNKAALQKFIAENPDAMNEAEIQQQLKESENYNKFGSVDGTPGGGQEYIFRSPDLKFDPNEVIANTFSQLKQQERQAKRGETVGIGGLVKEVPVENQLATANALLTGRDGRKMMNYWNAMTPEAKAFYGDDPTKWVMKVGTAFTGKDLTNGQIWSPDVYANAERIRAETEIMKKTGSKTGKVEPPPSIPAYDIDIKTMKPGQSVTVPAANIKAMLPSDMSVNNDFWINNGTALVPATQLNGMSSSVIPTGVIKYDPTGAFKITQVMITVPASRDLAIGDNPLLTGDIGFWEDDDDFQKDDYVNDPKKPYYKIVTGKDGKPTGNVMITGWTKLPENSATIRSYNDAAEPKKTVDRDPVTGLPAAAEGTVQLSGTEVNQQAQYDAAPSGTIFVNTDGTKFKKP